AGKKHVRASVVRRSGSIALVLALRHHLCRGLSLGASNVLRLSSFFLCKHSCPILLAVQQITAGDSIPLRGMPHLSSGVVRHKNHQSRNSWHACQPSEPAAIPCTNRGNSTSNNTQTATIAIDT